MNTRRLIVALALAAATSLGVYAAPALASDDWHNWHPDYQSAQDIIATYGAKDVADTAKQDNLPLPFTAKQYGAAKAEEYVARLRHDYQLGPDFTSAELAANAGAEYVGGLIKQYKMPTHFTEQQYKNAKLIVRLKEIVEKLPGLPFPFSSDDYVRARGAQLALEVAQKYQLATQWTYADLVAAAGPQEAASLRHLYVFGKGDTHTQIEHAMGVKSLAWLSDYANLPATFTADELVKLSPAFSQYSELVKLPVVNDQTLVAYYGSEEVASIFHSLRDYGLKETFTEAELRAAVAARAIAEEQLFYDLDPDFTSDSLAHAIALSKVASVRRELGLRPDFTAAEYQSAWEKHNALRNDAWHPYY